MLFWLQCLRGVQAGKIGSHSMLLLHKAEIMSGAYPHSISYTKPLEESLLCQHNASSVSEPIRLKALLAQPACSYSQLYCGCTHQVPRQWLSHKGWEKGSRWFISSFHVTSLYCEFMQLK